MRYKVLDGRGRAGTPGMCEADAIDLSSPSVPKHYYALFFARCTPRLRVDDLCVRARPLGEGQERRERSSTWLCKDLSRVII